MLLLFLMLNIFEGKLYVIKFNTIICNYSQFLLFLINKLKINNNKYINSNFIINFLYVITNDLFKH